MALRAVAVLCLLVLIVPMTFFASQAHAMDHQGERLERVILHQWDPEPRLWDLQGGGGFGQCAGGDTVADHEGIHFLADPSGHSRGRASIEASVPGFSEVLTVRFDLQIDPSGLMLEPGQAVSVHLHLLRPSSGESLYNSTAYVHEGTEPVEVPVAWTIAPSGPDTAAAEVLASNRDLSIGIEFRLTAPSASLPAWPCPFSQTFVTTDQRVQIASVMDVRIVYEDGHREVALDPPEGTFTADGSRITTRTGTLMIRDNLHTWPHASNLVLGTPDGWSLMGVETPDGVAQVLVPMDPPYTLQGRTAAAWAVTASSGNLTDGERFIVRVAVPGVTSPSAVIVLPGAALLVGMLLPPILGAHVHRQWAVQGGGLLPVHPRLRFTMGGATGLAVGTYAAAIIVVVLGATTWLSRGLPWPVEAYVVVVLVVSTSIILGLMSYGLRHHHARSAEEHAEEAARRAASMDARAGELESLTYGFSHDMKTPILALQWLVDDLRSGLKEPDEEVQATLDRLGRSISGMDQMVQDLLELSRIEQMELEGAKVSVRALVEEALSDHAEVLRRREADVEVAVEDDLEVMGDPLLMRQALRNVIGNGIKYGNPVHPRLRVEALRDTAARRVVLYIDDDGPGVPTAHREIIFRPLIRNPEETREIEGTGLGLTLVRRIAERHRGGVRCEDSPLGGARFVLWFGQDPTT